MRLNSQIWLYVSIGLLLCLVIVNGGVAYQNIRQLRDDARLVLQTQQVLRALETTVSTVKDAETGQRGYLLTGNAIYLAPYQDALERYKKELAHLESLAANSPGVSRRIPRLKELISTKLQELALSLVMHKEQNLAGVQELLLAQLGNETMREIRALVDAMAADEQSLLVERQRADERAYRSAVAGVLISALAGLAGLGGLAGLLRRQITSLEQSARSEAEQRELLRATLASIGDGVIATDVEGRVTFLNQAAEQLTGWSPAEAEGRDLAEVFQIVQEGSRQPLENPALSALREGRTVSLTNQTVLIARDGREWPVDDSAAPICAVGGGVSGSVLVFRDITQRNAHEAMITEHNQALQALNARMNELLWELKASEELFHTMADTIPQLAWMARADGHVYWYNRRWYDYTGAQAGETDGWEWQSLHDPEHLPRVLRSWKAAIAQGEPWEDTFPLRRHDGAMRWHLTRAEPMRDARGQVTRWFGTNTDVTQRLQMEEALREANRRKDDFVALLAHELRNPIAAIANALQVWTMVDNDRQEMDKLHGLMDRQVRLIRRLIDDLSDVARVSRGKLKLCRQPVELAGVVASAIEAVRPAIDSCGHHLEIDVAAEPLVVDGDPARLTQALSNLLQNAAKYTAAGGRIRVTARCCGTNAVIAVSDNGAGIPPHMLERIFEMFQQVNETLDRSRGGMGLGLTLVKRLVELHGGTVEAHSAGENQGSEFVVTLPLATQPAPAHDATRPPRPAYDLPRRRILVVDDVGAGARMLALMLERMGQEATVESDGEAAIEHVISQRPDVVFLDIGMPGLSGYDVVRRLRAADAVEGVTLVALTGYGQPADVRRALEAGFHHHLTKPASMEQLIDLIRSLPVADRAQNPARLAD